jgi:hypothetical protein
MELGRYRISQLAVEYFYIKVLSLDIDYANWKELVCSWVNTIRYIAETIALEFLDWFEFPCHAIPRLRVVGRSVSATSP